MPNFKPHRYEKDNSNDPFFRQVDWHFFLRTRLMAALLILLGLTIMTTQIVFPIYVFKTEDYIDETVTATVAGKVAGFSEFAFNELGDKQAQTPDTDNIPQYYYISIPRLRIKDARIETKPTSLSPDEALGHYIGTALPGEVGNSFIYGHSVLPMFYNPRNYKTIFSTLGSLQKGDEINVTYNNIKYVYKVDGKALMDPNDVDPSAKYRPDYLNDSTLTLMTCWPAGTKTKRLLVYAVKQ